MAESANGGAAARSKGRKTLKFEGLALKLPAKLPFKVLRHLGSGAGAEDVVGVLTAIVGDEQMDKVWDLDLDLDRGQDLVGAVLEQYGLTTGESPASQKS